MTQDTTTEQPSYPGWGDLLMQAVMQPGRLHDGYRFFHDYSVGNQQAALAQCYNRQLQAGPIATYNRWQERGRQVIKGQKAIWLCMPLTITKDRDGQPLPEGDAWTFFKFRPLWFVLSQTELMPGYTGLPWEEAPLPHWDRARALETLGITDVPFDHLNGNTQGFSLPKDRKLAINPVAVFPYKTTFHELGHVLMGHSHSEEHSSIEVEAELVAYLTCHVLDVDTAGLESGRAYVQHYLGPYLLDDKMAQRIFKTVTAIIEAGHPAKPKREEAPERPARKPKARGAKSSRRGQRKGAQGLRKAS